MLIAANCMFGTKMTQRFIQRTLANGGINLRLFQLKQVSGKMDGYTNTFKSLSVLAQILRASVKKLKL